MPGLRSAALAAAVRFTTAQVRRYGRTDTVHVAEVGCLWYGSFHTQAVRVTLLRDDGTDTGYDPALVTTDPATPPTDHPDAWRWSIEVTFADTAAKIRRVIIAARFLPAIPGRPTDAEIRAVQRALAQAGLDLAA